MRDPFGEFEASQEQELHKYFVAFPDFDRILGDQSQPHLAPLFVYAAHGMGKTAARVMIERLSQPYDAASRALAVSHTDFRHFGPDPLLTLDALELKHADHIAGEGAVALLKTALWRSHLAPSLYAEDWGQLKALFLRSRPRWLEPRRLASLVLPPNSVHPVNDAERLVRLVHAGERPKSASLPYWLRPALPTLVSLFDAPASELEASPLGLLETLRDLVLAIGLQCVYVLVDGADEFIRPDSPADEVRLVEPLVSVLRHLEIERVAFRFFLPQDMASAMTAYRPDRVLNVFLEWREADLAELLSLRLSHFHERARPSLAPICDAALAPWIDGELVRQARGSPRNLLRIGDLLFAEHCRVPVAGQSPLTSDEWRRVQERFQTALASEAKLVKPTAAAGLPVPAVVTQAVPRLRVDLVTGEVYLGGKRLKPPLGILELKFLACLYERRGTVCSYDELEEAVYRGHWRPGTSPGQLLPVTAEFASDANIASLAFHVRNKLETDRRIGHGRPKSSNYVKFIRGKGYWLDNTE